MGDRRMFAKTIVLSDAFLDMPSSARCLYFTLGMFADDDGFVNSPKGIMRQCGATDGDMQILLDKKFVLLFESGVIVIKHWRIHNYIQKDRYKPTKYKEEMALLTVDEKDGYSLIKTENSELEKIPLSDRQKAYEESELPYSFDYKIRNYFVGKTCPVCGATMSYSNNLVQPTIQHNIPISKGGKHEIGNISVICRSCNTSIKDNPTGELNAEEVAKAWDEISCIHSVSKMDTQVKLSKDKLSEVKKSKDNDSAKRFVPPTLEEVTEYCKERNNNVDPQRFIDYYTANGWIQGKGKKIKDWKSCIRTWERNNFNSPKRSQIVPDYMNEEQPKEKVKRW